MKSPLQEHRGQPARGGGLSRRIVRSAEDLTRLHDDMHTSIGEPSSYPCIVVHDQPERLGARYRWTFVYPEDFLGGHS